MILNNDEPNWQLPSQALKRTREKEGKGRCWKSWTSLRPERPGTRPKSTTKTNKRTDGEEARKTETKQQSRAIQYPRGKQTEEQSTKKREEPKGEQKGARASNTGSMPERGENHEEGARRAEESKQTNQSKQYQEKGEALTVLSQSTARKVRYLQIPGRGKDRCKE